MSRRSDAVVMPDWPRAMRAELAAAYVGISESTLHKEVKAKRFPAPLKLPMRIDIWDRQDLDAWVDQKNGRLDARAIDAAIPDAPSDWDLEFGDHRAA